MFKAHRISIDVCQRIQHGEFGYTRIGGGATRMAAAIRELLLWPASQLLLRRTVSLVLPRLVRASLLPVPAVLLRLQISGVLLLPAGRRFVLDWLLSVESPRRHMAPSNDVAFFDDADAGDCSVSASYFFSRQ